MAVSLPVLLVLFLCISVPQLFALEAAAASDITVQFPMLGQNITALYGGKTAYSTIFQAQPDASVLNTSCKVIYEFGFFRHGSRIDTDKNLNDLLLILKQVLDTCNSFGGGAYNSSLLESVCPRVNKTIDQVQSQKTKPSMLTDVGVAELQGIASRFYQVLLNTNSAFGDVFVTPSEEDRAKDSAEAFLKNFTLTKPAVVKSDESVAKYYKSDPVFSSLLTKCKTRALNILESNADVSRLAQELSRKLSVSLSNIQLLDIFMACGLSRTNNFNELADFWCPMVDNRNMHALLLQAINTMTYNERCLGLDYADTVACPLANQFMDDTKDILKQTPGQLNHYNASIARLLFGHRTGLIMLERMMRLFTLPSRDNFNITQLVAAAAAPIKQQRPYYYRSPEHHHHQTNTGSTTAAAGGSFDTSLLTPMAGNVQLRLYSCLLSAPRDDDMIGRAPPEPRLIVAPFVNEQLVPDLAMCPESIYVDANGHFFTDTVEDSSRQFLGCSLDKVHDSLNQQCNGAGGVVGVCGWRAGMLGLLMLLLVKLCGV